MLNSNNKVIKSKSFILRTKKSDPKFPIIENFKYSNQYSSEKYMILDSFSAVKTRDTIYYISIIDRDGEVLWVFLGSSYPRKLKNGNISH